MANTLFRCHGARFMRAVAAAVDNMDALDLVVVPNLVQLGRRASPASTSWSCRTLSSWAAAPRLPRPRGRAEPRPAGPPRLAAIELIMRSICVRANLCGSAV